MKLSVLVPTSQIAAAVDAAPELQAVLWGRHTAAGLADPWQAGPVDPDPLISAHFPAARALIADGHSWAQLEPVFAAVPSLELIQTLSQGVDFLRGLPDSIAVSNAAGAHGAATAELAMTLLLSSWRKLPQFVRAQDRGYWIEDNDRLGRGLNGARLVVLGAGNVAVEFAVRARAFGAEVTMVGRQARHDIHGFDELPALLPKADACIILVSLNSATYHMVNEDFLAFLPDGATLVNAARGGVVKTAALLAELDSGRLTAALDVTDPEPLPPDHPLWRTPGVLIAPHAGGATDGLETRAIGTAVAQLRQFAAGRLPDNIVPRADLI